VVGYNVYRASPGTAYVLVYSAMNGLNCTDGTVRSGQTYTYVVTAVDSAGDESAYSAAVTAVVP
jgi:hypothetical protein